ncbi:MAG: FAD-dependent oxidoreductase [Lentisphaeria bacterium]|nr:FAD-dependent oxidoreductase [Lentisphaeria bacterium]
MRNDFEKSYDVVVAGGGVAGVAAALAAARRGRRVALVEKTVLWGGLATTGIIFIYLPLCDGNGTQVTFGISEELLKAGMKYGPGDIPAGWKTGKNLAEEKRYRTVFSPASMVLALDELLLDSGCELWLDTQLIDAECRGGRVESVTVANKSGTGKLKAAAFVDATGDADIAFFAGAECPVMANALASWTLEYSEQEGGARLAPLIRASIVGGSVDPDFTEPGVNGRLVSDFVLAGRAEYRRRLWNEYESGKADRYTRFPLKVPAMADLRHTRRIDGEFTLLSGMEWQPFDDSIGVCADWRTTGKVWELPYRALLPKTLGNVLAAGRCISSRDDAWEVTRVIPVAALTGEAAGIAASLAAEQSRTAREVPYADVQQAMREAGNPVRIGELYREKQ